MLKITLETSLGKEITCQIKYPELIYGATAIVAPFPIQGEIYHPLTNENLPIIIEPSSLKHPYFLIPAHMSKHFFIGQKHKLPLKQVVAPLYQGTGIQKIRRNLPIQTRQSVIAVIKHWQNDSFLCVDSYNRKCKSFVLGGRENNETPAEAALRETIEETGYTDITIDSTYPIMLLNHFYADYKGVNRHSTLHIVFGHLNSDTHQTLSSKESKEHAVKWIVKSKLRNFLSVKNNLFALKILEKGTKAYTGQGLMINSGKLTGLSRNTARKLAVKLLS